jgi:hypothetical protein
MMFQKTFQVFLVVFVVLLTSAALILVFSGVVSGFMPLHTDSIVAVAGGVSLSILAFIGLLVLMLIIAAVYLFARPRLR